jgi:hypothetical protein
LNLPLKDQIGTGSQIKRLPVNEAIVNPQLNPHSEEISSKEQLSQRQALELEA